MVVQGRGKRSEHRDSLVTFVSICINIQDWKSTKGCSQGLQSEDSTEVDRKQLQQNDCKNTILLKKKTKPFFHLLALSFSVTQHSVLLVQALSITAKIFIMVVSLDLLISTQQRGQTSIFHSFLHLPYSLLPFLQPFIPLLSTLPHSILIKVLS